MAGSRPRCSYPSSLELCLRKAFGHYPIWRHFDVGPSFFARTLPGRYLADHPTRLSVLCCFWRPLGCIGGLAISRLHEAIFIFSHRSHIFVHRVSSGCTQYIKWRTVHKFHEYSLATVGTFLLLDPALVRLCIIYVFSCCNQRGGGAVGCVGLWGARF